MKLRLAVCLGCFAFGACFAKASGPVDMIVRPVMRNQAAHLIYPLELKFKNQGDRCSGMITLGGMEKEVQIPLQLNARETRSLVAYCPLEGGGDDLPQGGGNDLPFITVRYSLDSSSGPSEGKETMKVGVKPGAPSALLISSDRSGLDYLSKPKNRGTVPDKAKQTFLSSNPSNLTAADRTNEYLKEGMSVSVLAPGVSLNRENAFQFFSAVFLGKGSQTVSDEEFSTLKSYLVQGGQIVFGTDPNSATADPRWHSFLPKPGKNLEVGLGRVINLGFQFESEFANESLRYRVCKRIPRSVQMRLSWPDLRQDQIELGSKEASNPFKISLPGFGQIAAVLSAYFLLVVPINYFLLRRIQKPELMWVTAPVLAVGFSSMMFKSASSLYKAPASVVADGNLICQEGIDNAIYQGAFGIFTPTAGVYNLNLPPGTTTLDDYFNISGYQYRARPPLLPVVVDTGSINIPNYRSSNLQFREYTVQQVLDLPDPISFSVEKTKEGIYLLKAVNKTGHPLKNVKLLAGMYSATSAEIPSNGSILLAADGLEPLPGYLLEQKEKESSTTNAQSRLTGRDVSEMRIQTQGRIALVADCYDLPVGPRLMPPASLRSRLQLYCFAPGNLSIP